MMRLFFSGAAILALTACSPTVPDSGAGVGFGDYNEYQKQQAARDAALQGGVLPAAASVTAQPLPSTAVAAAQAANTGVVQASPSNPVPVQRTGGMSAENDFDAVSGQRSIESDAALRAQNQQQYQVIQPTALPSRSGGSGPNIVSYALQAKNEKGQQAYRRSSYNAQSKFQKNCAKYASPDQAQTEFLAKGGPSKDRLGLDPDGDGFACAWDPRPFRLAVGG